MGPNSQKQDEEPGSMTLTAETAAEKKFIGNRAEVSLETNFDCLSGKIHPD